MKIYPKNNQTQSYWRKYKQQRIVFNKICCEKLTILIPTENGYVKLFCLICQKQFNFSLRDFTNFKCQVSCPQCQAILKPQWLYNGRYGWYCRTCRIAIQLFDILKSTSELKNNMLLTHDDKRTDKRNTAIISQCIDCSKFNTDLCPGPQVAEGCYDRLSYFCGSFSRKQNLARERY